MEVCSNVAGYIVAGNGVQEAFDAGYKELYDKLPPDRR